MVIFALIYLAGFLLSYAMLRVEHEAEQNLYTKGARVLTVVLSFLSWVMIIWLLVSTWLDKISATGYWNRPVKVISEPEKAEAK